MVEGQVPQMGAMEGQLTASEGVLPSRLSVEVFADGRFVDRTHVADDGSFRFRSLPAGHYDVRVLDMRGDVLRQTFVVLAAHTCQVELRLEGVRQERPARGSVSIRSLMRPAPRTVIKQLQQSEKAFDKGDVRRSFEHLQRALEACSDCVEVHNNLGVRHMRVGEFDKAVPAFQRAVELDPDSVLAQSNLAIALASVKDYSRAEAAANRALALDAGSLAARYVLGLAGLSQRNCSRVTIGHLRAAADTYTRAHLAAAAAMTCMGDIGGAIHELTSYLRKPRVEQREQVEAWLAKLRDRGK
jgi:tetratricopeptide (TPR) repeat protein